MNSYIAISLKIEQGRPALLNDHNVLSVVMQLWKVTHFTLYPVHLLQFNSSSIQFALVIKEYKITNVKTNMTGINEGQSLKDLVRNRKKSKEILKLFVLRPHKSQKPSKYQRK